MTAPGVAGRAFVVTGASSGLGRETAALLAELGARVALVGRDEGRLAAATAALAGDGHRAYARDLADGADLAAWMRGVARDMGELDGLVHCAGLYAVRPLRVVNAETVERLFRVNVFAASELARGFRQRGVRRPGAGSLVFMASVAGLVGQAGLSTYSATKGALVAMARSLAVELAREAIRVNCVAPGVVRSEMQAAMRESVGDEAFAAVEAMHPLGLGEPRDVAHAVAFLLGDTARWITGTTLVVDGGYTAH